MKKKLLALLIAFACSASCAVALTACDSGSSSNNNGTEQGGGNQGDKEQGGNQGGTEQGGNQGTTDAAAVTAQQWTAAFTASLDNYTATVTQGSAVVSSSKFAGDKIEMEASGVRAIYGKVDNAYYGYMYYSGFWTRTVIPESAYTQMLEASGDSLTAFKDKYSDFTYANGVYTAATLSVTSEQLDITQTLTNVKVTFNNGALTGMEYDNENMHCVLKDIGSTTVTLPTEYTDVSSGNLN